MSKRLPKKKIKKAYVQFLLSRTPSGFRRFDREVERIIDTFDLENQDHETVAQYLRKIVSDFLPRKKKPAQITTRTTFYRMEDGKSIFQGCNLEMELRRMLQSENATDRLLYYDENLKERYIIRKILLGKNNNPVKLFYCDLGEANQPPIKIIELHGLFGATKKQIREMENHIADLQAYYSGRPTNENYDDAFNAIERGDNRKVVMDEFLHRFPEASQEAFNQAMYRRRKKKSDNA